VTRIDEHVKSIKNRTSIMNAEMDDADGTFSGFELFFVDHPPRSSVHCIARGEL